MANIQTHSSALAPFIRSGLDGGCQVCGKRVADHMDKRGEWLGCRGVKTQVPLILIPDRRNIAAMGVGQTPIAGGRKILARIRQDGRAEDRTPKPAPVLVSGPQVVYVAKWPASHKKVLDLAPADRKVYGLILRGRTKGATRAQLLEALDAHKRTGRVDGAVRRLRLRGVVAVVPVK